jgi:spore coat protein A, manganese oxidase
LAISLWGCGESPNLGAEASTTGAASAGPTFEQALVVSDPQPLAPESIPKYQEPLVIPPVMPPVGQTSKNPPFTMYKIAARQISQQVLPSSFPKTTVWGYGSFNDPVQGPRANASFNFPAFTVEVERDELVRVQWVNQLMDAQRNYLPHLLPVDPTLHWANPPGGTSGRDMRPTFTQTPSPYTGPVPIVTHLHGAHVPAISDGYPEAWYLPNAKDIPKDYAKVGTHYGSVIPAPPGAAWFEYPNDQRASTLWYHDHALGITRLNVYAGLAGFWIIRDETESTLNLPGPAPRLGDPPETKYYEIPLAIQDRSFNEDGSLLYPGSRAFFDGYEGPFIPETPVAPIWNPEFFGNAMVVNGKTWPYLEVEPRLYRLRFLNGCNSRFLILAFDQDLEFHQIGSEGGLLPDAPVTLDQLLMAPAERADVIIDFSGFLPGEEIVLLNFAPDEPFGGGTPGVDFDPADPETTGQVMKFIVVPLTAEGNPGEIPSTLPAIAEPGPADTVRDLILAEVMYPVADIPIAAELGTVADGPLEWIDPITENPMVGDTEIWRLLNLTEDAHPIHLHLVMFRVLDRQPFDAEEFAEAQESYLLGGKAGDPPDPSDFVLGDPLPPAPWETGWKDTVIAFPGEITRIQATFDLPGLYVWHCHILEHEDNEMMRPYYVGPVPAVMR